MNIYKTQENPSKNELIHNSLTKEAGIEYIDQYVLNYITAVYGGDYAAYFKTNRDKYVMPLDTWHACKDTLPKGHYFVQKDELVGYTIYVICETLEQQTGYMWNSDVLINNIIKVSSIFGVMKNVTIIDQSVIGVRAIADISDDLYPCCDSEDSVFDSSDDSDIVDETDKYDWANIKTRRIKEIVDAVNAEFVPVTTDEKYEQIGKQINMSIKKMNNRNTTFI